MNSDQVRAAKKIVKRLTEDLETAKTQLPPNERGNQGALVVALKRALLIAQNVLSDAKRKS
jgi:hypothetical protein